MEKIWVVLLCLFSITSLAQPTPGAPRVLKTPEGIIVCYACKNKINAYVPPPDAYRRSRLPGGRVQGNAGIEVTYSSDFSEDARRAFQKAVDIWNTLVTSPVTIKINATWRQLGSGVLGSCGPTNYYLNFTGAPRLNVWYPVALANKLANLDLNGESNSEMEARFNSSTSWHFDPDTNAPSGKYDLVSVVLHEIGHGLGIFSAFEVWENQGQIREAFDDYPCVYDLCLETGSNPLIGYTSPSSQLRTALTGNSLFFNAVSVLRLNTTKGQAYAPREYSSTSSLAHNDESAYPSGNSNSLMTPLIGNGETIHDPGPVTLGELSDMGWTNPVLAHTPLASLGSTTTDLPVICTLTSGHSDYAPLTNTLSLNYLIDSNDLVTVVMTSTGQPNEYRATIPKPASSQKVSYAYYFSVSDSKDRGFSWPGKTTTMGSAHSRQAYYKFKVGPNAEGPKITHTPIAAIKDTTTALKLVAAITDDFGIQGGVVEWMINTTAKTNVSLTQVADSVYTATLPMTGLTLFPDDVIKYRITATDDAPAHLSASLPAAGNYYTIKVVGYGPAQESYFNNFDNRQAGDFFGDFTIVKAHDFDNGAIHSPHPYAAAKTKKKNVLNFMYELLKPIKVKEDMGIIKFDEIVLTEPGKNGSVYGDQYFYDYVIVEGSTDKGRTWKAVANGWDSREKENWQQTWNSQKQGTNSTARGTSTLFHKRSLNLLKTFRPNEEVVLRFRLHSNSTCSGWGWAIDNLEIQFPVLILHNHLDYVMTTARSALLELGVVDANAISALSIEYSLNDAESQTKDITLNPKNNLYKLEWDLSEAKLKKGDYLKYRIKVANSGGYVVPLPPAGSFRADVLDLSNPAPAYDYSTGYSSADYPFAGNFLTQTSSTIETEHPYSSGFGLDYRSDFTAILKTPIQIDAASPTFSFDEKLTLGAGDYATVEGSKDGIHWVTLIDKYTSGSTTKRTGSLTAGNNFKGYEVVLLRFRLLSNKTSTGWGWEISNFKVEGSFTEIRTKEDLTLFPNPVKQGNVTVWAGRQPHDFSAQVMDVSGRIVFSQNFPAATNEIKLPAGHLPAGVYLVTIINGEGRRSLRFVKM